ncbi:hypothetical protein DFH07DRAFT_771898 [Mycena maculata]|uniref:Uncharacterized protein n=1 Tax=Mycena maculata TaxID=230809 RepID=A0AAD7J9Z7_9AGAR|nr:hypothetical protein DFH07DRAFT_771898 [Mycena maculata]
MAQITHFRGILFQTAPIIFGPIDQARRDALVDNVFTASNAEESHTVINPDLPTAVAHLTAFNTEFTAASAGQVATKKRVTDWVAGVQAALTEFVADSDGVPAANTLFLASTPEFGLNAYDGGSSAANVIPDTLEAFVVDELHAMLTMHFSAHRVLFMISCCTYDTSLQRDGPPTAPGHQKLGGISRITIIPSSPAIPITQILKAERAVADSWQLNKFANLYVRPVDRQAQLQLQVTFPSDIGPPPALGFSTCTDATTELHPNVNLAGLHDTDHSFLLNDAKGWTGDGPRDSLFCTGFYRITDNPPEPFSTIQLKELIQESYTAWDAVQVVQPVSFFGKLLGKPTKTTTVLTARTLPTYPGPFETLLWTRCWYIMSAVKSIEFLPRGLEGGVLGPVIKNDETNDNQRRCRCGACDSGNTDLTSIFAVDTATLSAEILTDSWPHWEDQLLICKMQSERLESELMQGHPGPSVVAQFLKCADVPHLAPHGVKPQNLSQKHSVGAEEQDRLVLPRRCCLRFWRTGTDAIPVVWDRGRGHLGEGKMCAPSQLEQSCTNPPDAHELFPDQKEGCQSKEQSVLEYAIAVRIQSHPI